MHPPTSLSSARPHRTVWAFLLAVALALSMVTLSPPAAQAAPSIDDYERQVEQELFQLHNGSRLARSIAPFSGYKDMRDVARAWSDEQAESGSVSHNPDFSTQIKHWNAVAENVGQHMFSKSGPTSESVSQLTEQLHEAFMASQGHCANLLNPAYDHVGFGATIVKDGDFWRLFVTVNFRDWDGTGSLTRVRTHDGSTDLTAAHPNCDAEYGEPSGDAPPPEDGSDPKPDPGPEPEPDYNTDYNRLHVSNGDRIDTAIQVARQAFNNVDAVVLSTHGKYPDALAGSPLAYKHGAPVLLNPTDHLDDRVAKVIDDLGAGKVYLLGGEAALSSNVADTLKKRGKTVERIAGESRWDTARRVAMKVGAPDRVAYVVEGDNADPNRGWPDAISAGPLAAVRGGPILLTLTDILPDDTRRAIKDLKINQVIIVGGKVAVSDAVAGQLSDMGVAVERLSGDTRYQTSIQTANSLASSTDATFADTWLATGLGWPDALAAGPAVAATGGVLVLVNGKYPQYDQVVYDYLKSKRNQIDRIHFVGGGAVITSEVEQKVKTAVG